MFSKGFYSIQVEKLNAGELVQCFVEEESLWPLHFMWCKPRVCWPPGQGRRKVTSSCCDAICVLRDLCNLLSIFSMFWNQQELAWNSGNLCSVGHLRRTKYEPKNLKLNSWCGFFLSVGSGEGHLIFLFFLFYHLFLCLFLLCFQRGFFWQWWR